MNDVKCKSRWIDQGGNGDGETEVSVWPAPTFFGADAKKGPMGSHGVVLRSLDPALVLGGTALSQVWLFIVAPLVGGALAALLHRILVPTVETLQPDFD